MCDHYLLNINCNVITCGPVQTGKYSRRAPIPKYVTAIEICEEKLLTITITLTFKVNDWNFDLTFVRILYSFSIKLMTCGVYKSVFSLTGEA